MDEVLDGLAASAAQQWHGAVPLNGDDGRVAERLPLEHFDK